MKENVAEFLNFRYEKLKLLKRSKRGEVWLAQTRQSGDLVIIKRVRAVGLPYDLLRRSEFTLPAKIFYCVEDSEETVIVEEFIQGEHLHRLSEPQARQILLQMCDGLKELHEQKIIHRDIKPSNMILQGERIRLIDFDAARLYKDGKEEDTHLLGTKGYAPPEQYGQGQTDPRSDIYSLGVTFKELLGTNCGGRLKDILDKCTAYYPDDRFQDVDELKDALTLEDFDEPTLTEQEPRKLDMFFFAARIILFVIRREFHAPLIVLMIIILLLATSQTLNSGENFQEVKSTVEELE
ncbi:MAG: serine/threonine protein kinase [Selenomonadaceae bacterium]|nr:serine/threonine protein kinase [Selenomonadaceae bacterium]MBQ6758338.1 serine/threonine protein kinase [Selenomonadaceae bacterium]